MEAMTSSSEIFFSIHTFTSLTDGNLIMLSTNEGGIMKIGRTSDCYVPLRFENDKHISKTHALMWFSKSGNLFVMDMESQNGTFINDQRLFPLIPTIVNSNDVVSFSKKSAYTYLVSSHEVKQEE